MYLGNLAQAMEKKTWLKRVACEEEKKQEQEKEETITVQKGKMIPKVIESGITPEVNPLPKRTEQEDEKVSHKEEKAKEKAEEKIEIENQMKKMSISDSEDTSDDIGGYGSI